MASMQSDLLEAVRRVHFVGIGGSGMSPLVEILHTLGYRITGSDNNESDNITRLRGLGITVCMGHAAENVGDAELVVYTAAVSSDNPELAAARKRNIPLMERAHLLGLITRRYPNTVAIAGTHGKTTTSSMTAQILLQASLDPSVFIGGRLPLINANGRAGSSDTMICEACEFQDHYLEMEPAISVILNVDADHLDYFGSLENVIRSFAKFAGKTRHTVIVNAADPHAPKAVAALNGKTVITYGYDAACDWSARNVSFENGSYGCFDLYHGTELITAVRLGVPGEHNVLNAVAAAVAAFLCGATGEQIAAGLRDFHGAGRRFEFLGTVDGVTFADDYAHHPTEITATLTAAKALGYRRVWAIFQPFTFSRTARHLEEFAASLSLADRVIVSDIMGSREVNTWGVSSEQIVERITAVPACHCPTFADITEFLLPELKEGDLVLTMGGGDVYKCCRMVRDARKAALGENE